MDEDACSLPPWTYHDPGFFEAETAAVFRQSWQLVCHLSDIPKPGDWYSLEFLGEPLLTVRGEDGAVRSFHNVCRHRASRLLDGARGNCGARITCPYHHWTYALDGHLLALPERKSYPGLDLGSHGLTPLEQEICLGFVFVRLQPGLPTVREMLAPYLDELAACRMEDLVPQGRVTLRPREVNWKNVADNYADGLHIPVAHPGLMRLFGRSYRVEAREWVDKMWGEIVDAPSPNWCERLYQRWLSPECARRWSYYKLWPNLAFDVYPDQIDFMQFLPVSATRTTIREIAYMHPDARREMRALRYLNWRINRQVNREDTVLIERVQAGMRSAGSTAGPLGETEVCLRSFARRLRGLIPEAREQRAPPVGWWGRRQS
jgi:phenylpropionate dioxygenase-like ring-hydroxylating dioxygenase large terminal subunit